MKKRIHVSTTVYRFKPWARLKGDAQKVGEEIERVRETSGGTLAPRNVVRAAQAADSILHPYFEWDNAKAGDQFRESQAAHLIRSIVVVRAEGVDAHQPVRAFVSVEIARDDNEEKSGADAGSYTSIEQAVRIVSYREQMMRNALRDLDAYRIKYQLLGDITRWSAALELARKWMQKALDASQESTKEKAA
jgi:hypothetical protein